MKVEIPETSRTIYVDGYEPVSIRATKNIVISFDDNTVDLNIYGEWAVLIAQAVTTEVMLESKRCWRFESKRFPATALSKDLMDKFEKEIRRALSNPPTKGSGIHDFVPVIKL